MVNHADSNGSHNGSRHAASRSEVRSQAGPSRVPKSPLTNEAELERMIVRTLTEKAAEITPPSQWHNQLPDWIAGRSCDGRIESEESP